MICIIDIRIAKLCLCVWSVCVNQNIHSYDYCSFYMIMCLCVVATNDSVVHSTLLPDPVPDASTLEFGSNEVHDILKAKGMKVHYYTH